MKIKKSQLKLFVIYGLILASAFIGIMAINENSNQLIKYDADYAIMINIALN